MTRPLPDTDDPVAGPFWTAAREHRLEFQRCAECGYHRWPPAELCPECLSPEAEWTQVPPRGRVWSFCVYEHCYHEAFRADLPYNVALVELESGPRILTNIVGADATGIEIGMPVLAEFTDVDDQVTLVRFRPAT